MELHLGTVFEAIADEFGDDEALVHGDVRQSWCGFEAAASRFAGFLAEHGVGADQKVALCLHNCSDYLIAQFGAFKQRAVPINVNYRYLDDELAYVLDNADAELLVYHASLADRIGRVRARLRKLRVLVEVDDRSQSTGVPILDGAHGWGRALESDPARRISRAEDDVYMLYTGGTTGMPKGVMFRMADFVRRLFTGYTYRGWDPPDDAGDIVPFARDRQRRGDRRVAIPACPLMHGTGMWLGAFYIHLMGGSCVTLPSRRFEAEDLWTTAAAERADALTIVGDAFARPMLDALDRAAADRRPYRLDDLRIIHSSGVMWSAEVQRGLLRHLDVRLVDSMGSTEGGIARRILTRGQAMETAVFELLPTTKVLTEDGRDVTPGSGEAGRMAASATVPIGYFKDPEKSAATFPVIGGRRYALAGDWATIDADGRVVLLGRGSHCINTGGEKVYPEEVEEAMKRHPAVLDCLVFGQPDERFGERVVAVVSVAPEALVGVADLAKHVRDHLSAYKVPRDIHVVASVERAANGKADYAWAREVAAACTNAAR